MYLSYNFIDKDPVIDKVRTAIQRTGVTYAYIEKHSGVTRSCLKKWFEGETRKPQACTVNAVLRCLPGDFTYEVLENGVPIQMTRPKLRRVK